MNAAEHAVTDHAAAAPMRAQVERWAAINSGTDNVAGLRQIADLLRDAFASLPGSVQLIDPIAEDSILADGRRDQKQRGRHLHLCVRPDARRRILLTGHMDTVFPADHPFQTVHEVEPGIINGPGVADMKGGLAVMLAALTALETTAAAADLGYDVLINSDEETGSVSSAGLIAALAQGKIAALTYEPAVRPDGTLAGARPGSGNFSFIITGKSAHAGRNPEDGRNAVVAAALLGIRLTEAMIDGLSVNVARIDGGGPNNVVPDHAILRVNMRPATARLETYAKDLIVRSVEAIETRLKVSIDTHGGFGRPPKPIDAKTEGLFTFVRQCGADLGQTIGWAASGGVCDGNNIAACGVPVVDTMGVRGGAIHSPDEYLIVASLAERAMLSALTLHRIAAGGFA